MGPDLARKLAQLVKMEKNVMRSIEQQARERREVAKQLSLWGEDADEDVSDVTDKLGVLIYEIGELEDQFIDKYDQYRITLKSVRNIEASVQPSRDRKQKITDQIAHLKYKGPTPPRLLFLSRSLSEPRLSPLSLRPSSPTSPERRSRPLSTTSLTPSESTPRSSL